MADVSPEVMAKRLRSWTEGKGQYTLEGALKQVLDEGDKLIARTATSSPHMRLANRRPPTHTGKDNLRRPGDTGPLRRVSNKLARAVQSTRAAGGGQRAAGGVSQITYKRPVATLQKGVDLDKVPYARRHEDNPKYSYLAPAAADEKKNIKRTADVAVSESLKRALNVL